MAALKDHTHPEPVKCAHDLGWCEKCQKPYCKACGKEWQDAPTYDFAKLLPHPEPYRPRPVPQWGENAPWLSPPSPGITWTAPNTIQTIPYPPGTILCEHKA